jgi:hypothetical protein
MSVFLGFDHFSSRVPPIANFTRWRVGSESLGSGVDKSNTHPADIERPLPTRASTTITRRYTGGTHCVCYTT